jgi:predicted dehydrogenase
MLIEKPLCSPDLNGCGELLELSKSTGCNILVGYNHALCKNTAEADKVIKTGALGKILSLNVRWLEYWGGIFSAHPWLSGPKDSYLGFSDRGGGACGEHSHGIHIWQYFAHAAGYGRISEVSCMMDMVSDQGLQYDRICQISVKTEKGLVGSIVQDVITEPSIKTLRIQGDRGWMEWYANYDKGQDAIIHGDGKGQPSKILVAKTRPDDFKGEIEHIGSILSGRAVQSPISLERGLEVATVIAAAHQSHKRKKTVKINYDKGYSQDSVV